MLASLPHQQVIPLSKTPLKVSMYPVAMIDNEMDTISFSIDATLTFNLSQVRECQALSIRISLMESKFFSKDIMQGCGQIQVPNTITPNMETVLSTTLLRQDKKMVGTIYSALTLLRRCVSGSFPIMNPYKPRMNMMYTRCKTMNTINGDLNCHVSSVNSSLSRISTSNPYAMVEIVDEESGILFNIPGNYEKFVNEFVQSNQFCETISTFLFRNIELKDRRGNFIDSEMDQIKLQLFSDCEQSLKDSNSILIDKMMQQDQISAFLNFESQETSNSFDYQQFPNFVENFRDRKVQKFNESRQTLSNEWIFYNQSLNRRVKVEVLVMFEEKQNSLIVLEHRTTLDETNNYSKPSKHSNIIEGIARSVYLFGSKHSHLNK